MLDVNASPDGIGGGSRVKNGSPAFNSLSLFTKNGLGSDPESVRALSIDPGAVLFEEIFSHLFDGQTAKVLETLDAVRHSSGTLPPYLVTALEHYEEHAQVSLLVEAVRYRAGIETFKALIEAGVPLNTTIEYTVPHFNIHAKGNPLHYIAAYGELDALKLLVARQSKVDYIDSLGRTPLTIVGLMLQSCLAGLSRQGDTTKEWRTLASEALKSGAHLIAHGGDAWIQSPRSESFGYSFLRWRIYHQENEPIFGEGTPLESLLSLQLSKHRHWSPIVDRNEPTSDYIALSLALFSCAPVELDKDNLRATTQSLFRSAADEMLQDNCSLEALVRVLKVLKFAQEYHPHTPRSDSHERLLAPIMDELLYERSINTLWLFVKFIDEALFNDASNPWTAELLQCFTHASATLEHLNVLGEAISAPYNLKGKKITSFGWDTVDVFRDCGILISCHPKFKADTRRYVNSTGNITSLFEEYGFKRCHSSEKFGSVFRREQDGNFIEFTHGGIFVVIPNVGSAFFRGSSPLFSRWTASEPVFFSEDDFESRWRSAHKRELDNHPMIDRIHVSKEGGFDHLLNFQLHKNPTELIQARPVMMKLRRLIDFVFSELDSYAQWKCNLDRREICTKDPDGKFVLLPGAPLTTQFSPGLIHIAEQAADYIRANPLAPPQALAWVRKRGAGLGFFDFVGPDGLQRLELELTPSCVRGLKGMILNQSLFKDVVPTGLFSFFDRGIELGSDAELVIINREVR